MTMTIILGDGALGRAVEAALSVRTGGSGPADQIRRLGRPTSGRHDRTAMAGADLIVEASRPDAVVANLVAGLEAGARRAVIATTGWETDRSRVESLLREYGAAAVAASNFSLGVVVLPRVAADASLANGNILG